MVTALGARLAWRRLPWFAEIASILFFYGIYSVVRVLSPHRVGVAFDNAADVLSFERSLGLPSELRLNLFMTHHHLLEEIASYYYVSAHYLVTTVVLVWLWKRRRDYAPLRSALVLSSLFALVVYAGWPLAPPRYAVPGAVDTVDSVLQSSGHGVSGLVNDIAAMPSMHVGWALWCAVVVVTVLKTPFRHLAWLYPVATTVVVVATANHYLLDAVGGCVVVAAPLYLCGLRRERPDAATADAGARVPEGCAA